MKYCPRSCACRIPGGSDFEWTLVDHLHSWKDDLIDWANGIVGGPLLLWTLRSPCIQRNDARLVAVMGRIPIKSFEALDRTKMNELIDVLDSARTSKMKDVLTKWAEELQAELRRREEER